MTQRKPWTDKEVQQLQEHYKRGDWALLVPLLGRTWKAIKGKAKALGLRQEKPPKPWTDKEVQQLQEHYKRGDWALLVPLLGRTRMAIKGKANALGLRQEMQPKPWTDKEVQQLQEHYKRGEGALLVPLLGRTRMAIQGKAKALGLRHEKTWKTCPTCRRTLLRATNFYEIRDSRARGGTGTESRCKDCYNRLRKERINSNPELRARTLERGRQRGRRRVDGLESGYLATSLGLKLKEVPEALLEAKREQLTLRRLARQLKEAAHESSEDAS